MRSDRIQAMLLRRQEKSYKEISAELKIPLSTLTYWFKDNEWSKEIKQKLIKKAQIKAIPQLKLMADANKKKWDQWHQDSRDEANKEFLELKESDIFLAGLMLYWGEGDKILKNGKVRLSNSDPAMIKVFYLFLLKLGVPKNKIFVELILYPDLKDKTLKAYWSKSLGISKSQFMKSAVIIGKHPERRLSYGICILSISSRQLKEKIMTWVYLYSDYLQKNNLMSYNITRS